MPTRYSVVSMAFISLTQPKIITTSILSENSLCTQDGKRRCLVVMRKLSTKLLHSLKQNPAS